MPDKSAHIDMERDVRPVLTRLRDLRLGVTDRHGFFFDETSQKLVSYNHVKCILKNDMQIPASKLDRIFERMYKVLPRVLEEQAEKTTEIPPNCEILR
jgi:hypothetical protein